MKVHYFIVLFSLGLTACSVHTEKFRSPTTGKAGYSITCSKPKGCYSEATSRCPEGYSNVVAPSGEQSEEDGKRLVIECN